MIDRKANNDWLLNRKAIKAARVCINAVQDELGIKLKLSHPEFLDMLSEYTELTDSQHLRKAYQDLLLHSDEGVKASVVELRANQAASPFRSSAVMKPHKESVNGVITPLVVPAMPDEEVTYHGKKYLRWQDGKEFSGLYRGQPKYS